MLYRLKLQGGAGRGMDTGGYGSSCLCAQKAHGSFPVLAGGGVQWASNDGGGASLSLLLQAASQRQYYRTALHMYIVMSMYAWKSGEWPESCIGSLVPSRESLDKQSYCRRIHKPANEPSRDTDGAKWLLVPLRLNVLPAIAKAFKPLL